MDIKKRIANLKDSENEKARAVIEVSLKTFNDLVNKLDSIEFGADKSVSLDKVYKYIKAQGIDANSLGGFKLEDLALKLHGHDEFKKTFNREEFLEYKKEIQIDSEKISKNLTNLFYELEKLKNQKEEEKIKKELIKIKDKSNKIVKSIEKIQKKGLEIVENIDFKGFRVMNIGDPVNATDAVNRKYVDKVSSLLNTKIPTYLGGPVPNPAGKTTWGSIDGTLSNQLDLQSALNAKLGASAQAADSALLQGHNAAYFQVAGNYLTSISGLDHNTLGNLAVGDVHTQYALLGGRSGGQTLIGGSAVDDILKLQGTSGNGTLTSPAIQLLVGNNGATVGLTILNNGNVGIGTTGPGNKLTIDSASLTAVPVLGANGGNLGLLDATGVYGLLAGVLNNGNAYLQVQRVDAGQTAYNMLLQPNTGNVGIGTTSPGATLTVQSTGAYSGLSTGTLFLQNTATGGNDYTILGLGQSDTSALAMWGLGGHNAINSGLRDTMYMGTQNSYDVKFVTNDTPRLTILSGGNVGIGTTGPSTKLHILGTTEQLRLGYDVSNYMSFTVGSDGSLSVTPTGTGQLFKVGANIALEADNGTGYFSTISATNWNTGSNNSGMNFINRTFNNASGVQVPYQIVPTINQSSTAGFSALRVSPYLQGTGSGTNLLLDVGTNSAGNGAGTHTSLMVVNNLGNVGIGTTSPNANAILDLTSTTKAFMPPRMTTTQRDAISTPTEGMCVWNLTTHAVSYYNGTSWV